MYMVVWTLVGGRQMSRGRAYSRRNAAERALLRERAEFPSGEFRVQQVSFWSKSAFNATVMLWGFALYVLVIVALVIERFR
jgi:hypothetical protein